MNKVTTQNVFSQTIVSAVAIDTPQTSDRQKTPLVTRGLNAKVYQPDTKMVALIDWFQGTGVCPSIEDLRSLIGWLMDEIRDEACWFPDVPVYHGKRWECSGISAGAKCCFAYTPNEDGTVAYWLSIPGGAIARCGQVRFHAVLGRLASEWHVNTTRLDVAIDDYQKRIDFATMLSALDGGNFSGFRKWSSWQESDGGITLYMGRRMSEKFIRYYDKSVESKGKIDAFRLECELRDDRAKAAFKAIVSLHGESVDELLPAVIGGLVVGSLDFVDRSSGDRLERQDRLVWWRDFVDEVGSRICLSVARARPSLERTLEWVKRQVSPSLALIADVLGGFDKHLLARWKDEARQRYTETHRKRISVASSEWLSKEFSEQLSEVFYVAPWKDDYGSAA